MAPTRWNPVGFTPWPVATVIVAVYAVLFSVLVTFQNVVPRAPSNPTPYTGINLTEAWHDLEVLTNGYHPYNSHRNDEVRDWLLRRIETILDRNNGPKALDLNKQAADPPYVLFNDVTSNLTFSSSDSSLSVAFTGTNIMVYIRGLEDAPGEFWSSSSKVSHQASHKGGVLVNAHFDSVPSGYGATDDGVGVITILQLISYFSHPSNKPQRGIVALLNNGEEDYLNGAYAFSQHPISKFPHIFLNLEGAGAGGRAALFRTTDTQVTRFYKKAPYPFGTVISADGFKRGLVRSQTDYVVFNGELGMRGLDVAFLEPRSRYHTSEDSAKYTSKDSLWHMLSGALATMQGLTSDMSDDFEGPAAGPGKVESGKGSDPVWFDLFGRAFAVFELHSLFAVSVTLLVVTPLVLIGLTIVLMQADKWYPFTSSKTLEDREDSVKIFGLKGLSRTPIALVVATAAVVGLAYLVMKVNPYIIYSSEYSVWSTFISAWLFIIWFILRGANMMRPSVLQRFYALLWIYMIFWVVMVGVTILENQLGLAGGYFVVFYFGAIFVALLISYLELFSLPKKQIYAELAAGYDSTESHGQASVPPSNNAASSLGHAEEDDEANERTSLIRGRRTFGGGYGSHRSNNSIAEHENELYEVLFRPYEKEQAWSGSMPSWTWLLQFIILGPFMIILCGQIALLQTAGLHQTPADGNSVVIIYLFIVALTFFIMLPVTPFIHRLTLFIPAILFLICVGTLLYNLLAFPFSDNARLKTYFVQQVNLDTGINKVSLTGLPGYTENIISMIPSSSGQTVDCGNPEYTARSGLHTCSWSGPEPNVVLAPPSKKHLPPDYSSWMKLNVTRSSPTANSATIHLSGANTRACRLFFNSPISGFKVKDFATDPRFPSIGSKGCKSIRLWSREWSGAWTVKVEWDGEEGLDGKAVCLWSDANDKRAVPAWEEVGRYIPRWSTVTKLSDGLVEGFKEFKV